MACRALPAGTAPPMRNDAPPVPRPRRNRPNLSTDVLSPRTDGSSSSASASSWQRAFDQPPTPGTCYSGPAPPPPPPRRTRRPAPVPQPRRRKMKLPADLLSPGTLSAAAAASVTSSSGSSLERSLEQPLTVTSPTYQTTSPQPVALLEATADENRRLHKVVVHKSWPTECVCGVALLNDELFVLCHGRADQQLDVHSTADYSLLRRLSVPGLGRYDAHDVASCALNNCLYVSDIGNSCVHRVGAANGSVSKWKVPYEPCGLSVTPAGSVLVVCRGDVDRLLELVADGTRLRMRQIKLPSDVSGPCQAAQLTAGHFVVCQRGQSGLCVVDADGRVTQSYLVGSTAAEVAETNGTRPPPARADREDDETELGCPCHVTVDGQFVLVVDHDNHRVVSLSRSLQFLREVVAVAFPNRLYVDHATRRLYIGHACGVTVIHL